MAWGIGVCLGLMLVGSPGTASAHEGDGRAEVVPAQSSPGGEVTVHGTGLTAGGVARVELATADGARSLGSGAVAEDGSISVAVSLPDDLAARHYELHLVGVDGLELVGYVEVIADESPEDAPGPIEAGWGPWLVGVIAMLAMAIAIAIVVAGRPRSPRRA